MSAINKTVSQSVNQLIDISKKEAEQADRQTDRPSFFFLLFISLSFFFLWAHLFLFLSSFSSFFLHISLSVLPLSPSDIVLLLLLIF